MLSVIRRWLFTFSTSPLKPLKGIQRNLTGNKISTSSTKFVSGRFEKQDSCPGIWFAEIFSTSPLTLLSKIQRNLIGSKISASSTKFVFFGPIEKKDGHPGLRLEIFSTFLAFFSTKLDRKQDLNILYQVCVFRADRKNKMFVLSDLSVKIAHCTQVHDMWPLGPLACMCFVFSFSHMAEGPCEVRLLGNFKYS